MLETTINMLKIITLNHNSMSLIFKRFKKQEPVVPISQLGLQTDVHTHIVPSIDDGSNSTVLSLQMIEGLHQFGFQKIIATPHVMSGYFNNTTSSIQHHFNVLAEQCASKVNLQVAAEYYMDYEFAQLIEQKSVLTFGEKYVLFEFSFNNEPHKLQETIFALQINGYTPVLAHPERYMYYFKDFSPLEKLHERGVLFQLNLLSLIGFYSDSVCKQAQSLVNAGLCDFLGSDAHNMQHVEALKNGTIPQSVFDKLMQLNILNNNI